MLHWNSLREATSVIRSLLLRLISFRSPNPEYKAFTINMFPELQQSMVQARLLWAELVIPLNYMLRRIPTPSAVIERSVYSSRRGRRRERGKEIRKSLIQKSNNVRVNRCLCSSFSILFVGR